MEFHQDKWYRFRLLGESNEWMEASNAGNQATILEIGQQIFSIPIFYHSNSKVKVDGKLMPIFAPEFWKI